MCDGNSSFSYFFFMFSRISLGFRVVHCKGTLGLLVSLVKLRIGGVSLVLGGVR